MTVNLTDIHPLSDFQRNPEEHIQELKATGRPAVLTVDGQPEIVVQCADAYRRLIEDQELLESIRGISRGMEQAKRGEGKPMREFLESVAREHGILLG
jgi:PHD/YefM family antitoxin component YafN of YafNO toxin-antitoxin module